MFGENDGIVGEVTVEAALVEVTTAGIFKDRHDSRFLVGKLVGPGELFLNFQTKKALAGLVHKAFNVRQDAIPKVDTMSIVGAFKGSCKAGFRSSTVDRKGQTGVLGGS